MSSQLTLEDVVNLRRAMDKQTIPQEGRVVRMHEWVFPEWCRVLGLDPKQVKHTVYDGGIIEVSV